ncbi:MAG: GDSL-type esterase/lipase family protein [Chthoniobacteraceae bacterium]
MRTSIYSLALVVFSFTLLHASEPVITLKDNDTWVMAGDSITAQRLHSNYIEAFYRTRYPQFHLHFRNSGIGGNKTGDVLARFDYDVAAWKPTIVSVELGMNDVSAPTPEGYVAGMQKLAGLIRALPAQPLLFSSSPVNDGSLLNQWESDRCQRLHPFTEALKEMGKKENVPVIDQYHALLDVWGVNRIVVDAGSLADRAATLKPESGVPGLDQLKAFSKAWANQPRGVQLGGDSVHTGFVGQYCMAAVILKGLGADNEVSSATIKTDGTVVESKRCKISDVSAKDGKITFTRLDECSPWPILPAAAPALKLVPEIAELSHYMLTITGLPAGKYSVSMDGKSVATLTEDELAKGWNMGALTEGAPAARATKIMSLIDQLQNPLNIAWRAASKAHDEAKLAEAEKAIEDCEAQVQTAVQPTAIKFEIAPAVAANP